MNNDEKDKASLFFNLITCGKFLDSPNGMMNMQIILASIVYPTFISWGRMLHFCLRGERNGGNFVGVPVTKMEILAFALSGLMAGPAYVSSIITICGASQQMGSFTEMLIDRRPPQ